MISNHAAGLETPVFAAEGRIVCGTKSIWQKQSYAQVLACIDNDAICTLMEIFNLGKKDIGPVFFLNKKNTVNANSSLLTADVRDAPSSDKPLGTYALSLSLRDDGLIRVESTCVLDDPSLLKTRYSMFQFPPYMTLVGEYADGEQTVAFDEQRPVSLSGDELEGVTFRFFPGSSEKSFSITPDRCEKVNITPHAISFYAKQTGVMGFLMDIRGAKSAEKTAELSPNGINFWEIDKLHLPDYGACRNLVVNPSFEAGLRYWGHLTYTHDIVPLKYTSFYSIDTEEAHSGSASLRMRALSFRTPLPLGTMAIPYIPGKPYTLSFYAKGCFDSHLTVNLWGRGQRTRLFDDKVLSLDVDREWKRYTVPVMPQERFCSIFFDARLSGASGEEEGCVWIDDIQIEQGDVSDFTQPPVTAVLRSAARGNFLEFGQTPEFMLDILARPDAEGTVALSVEDFFFKTVFEAEYRFTTDSRGRTTFRLDELSRRIIEDELRGVFCVSAIFDIAGGDRSYRDCFRFSVMDFLDNTHKNKDIFNLTYVYSLQAGGPGMERFLERERAIGFGSICYDFIKFANDLDYALDKERMALVDKYGFGYMGRPVLKLHDGQGGEISEEGGAVKMVDVKTRVDPTDAELAEFEAICELKARNRPWNKIWWFTGESNPGCMPLESHPDAFAKFLLATLRGIKRGNPEAEVLIEGGPWTMDPKYGAAWVERYIRDTKRIDPTAQFGGAACHHYRNFPENPDLDADVAAFIDMLDRNGCEDWPFHINEGGNYCPFNIPQEGISPYIVHSANAWYIRPLSYHCGRSERISAAFSARNWLVGLKYQDRVACMQDFNTPNRYVDIDFTPRFYEKIPNTLGRLLGNASFHKDIRFAPYCRCYVFKDDKTGTPIAAVWGHKEGVDRWKEPVPLYTFDFSNQEVAFVDLMENEVSFPPDAAGRSTIPISPFPLFIKAMPGAEAQLCDAIAQAAAVSDVQSLDVAAFPDADGNAAVVFRNPVSRAYRGEATITLNGDVSKVPVETGGVETLAPVRNFTRPAEPGEVSFVRVIVRRS